jgi:hypothetical protein
MQHTFIQGQTHPLYPPKRIDYSTLEISKAIQPQKISQKRTHGKLSNVPIVKPTRGREWWAAITSRWLGLPASTVQTPERAGPADNPARSRLGSRLGSAGPRGSQAREGGVADPLAEQRVAAAAPNCSARLGSSTPIARLPARMSVPGLLWRWRSLASRPVSGTLWNAGLAGARDCERSS